MLPLLRLLIPDRVIAATVLVGGVDTLRLWFSSSVIFLFWIADISYKATIYSIASSLNSASASFFAPRFLLRLCLRRAAAL